METHRLFDNIVASDERYCPLKVLVLGLICDVCLRYCSIPISKEGIIGLVLAVRLLSIGFKEIDCSGHVKLWSIGSTLTFFLRLHGLWHAIIVYISASRTTESAFLYDIIHMEALVSADVINDCQTDRFLIETDMRLTPTSARTRVSTLTQALGHEGGTRTVSLAVIWIDFLVFFFLTHCLIYYVYCARLSGSTNTLFWAGSCLICCVYLRFFSVIWGSAARWYWEGLADLSYKFSCLIRSV